MILSGPEGSVENRMENHVDPSLLDYHCCRKSTICYDMFEAVALENCFTQSKDSFYSYTDITGISSNKSDTLVCTYNILVCSDSNK